MTFCEGTCDGVGGKGDWQYHQNDIGDDILFNCTSTVGFVAELTTIDVIVVISEENSISCDGASYKNGKSYKDKNTRPKNTFLRCFMLFLDNFCFAKIA